MKKKRTLNPDTTAGVRKASRDAAVGKGLPGRFNPNRSVRFRSKATDKLAARGRTWNTQPLERI